METINETIEELEEELKTTERAEIPDKVNFSVREIDNGFLLYSFNRSESKEGFFQTYDEVLLAIKSLK